MPLSLQTLLHMGQTKTFGVDINLVHSHMLSQTCCRLTYFVKELTRITGRLMQKVQCKIYQQHFAVMWSKMTKKSGFVQTNFTVDVTNVFRVKTVQFYFRNIHFQMLCPILLASKSLQLLWITFSILFCFQSSSPNLQDLQ